MTCGEKEEVKGCTEKVPQRVNAENDAFPWGAWPRDAAVDTRKQAGRQSTALTGASSRSCHVTKRFRILATLQTREQKYVQQHIRICTHGVKTGLG